MMINYLLVGIAGIATGTIIGIGTVLLVAWLFNR